RLGISSAYVGRRTRNGSPLEFSTSRPSGPPIRSPAAMGPLRVWRPVPVGVSRPSPPPPRLPFGLRFAPQATEAAQRAVRRHSATLTGLRRCHRGWGESRVGGMQDALYE